MFLQSGLGRLQAVSVSHSPLNSYWFWEISLTHSETIILRLSSTRINPVGYGFKTSQFPMLDAMQTGLLKYHIYKQ